jgi:hypothetical protein
MSMQDICTPATPALVQSQDYVYRSCAFVLAKAAGWRVLHGADTPFLVWGF